MTSKRQAQICTLLKGIETGDPASVAVVNPNKYIQHNPLTHEGGEGLAALFKRIAKSSPKVNIVRIFSDGDYVFGHTEYDFASSKIGFEVFRFEGEQTVEHWDNIQSRQGPNSSGHSMVDGEVNVCDLEQTEINRGVIQAFVADVLINGQIDRLADFVCANSYTEHNARVADGLPALRAALTVQSHAQGVSIEYKKRHRVLAQGNFVLSVCEGSVDKRDTSFYDLYRLANGKIVEHWDTRETIPPRSEWNNENGKF